jgi:hypothetical protein
MLGRSRWWTEPVPAERLAALRIGLAAVLLADVLALYLPQMNDFFGPESLAGIRGDEVSVPHWTGFLVARLGGAALLRGLMIAWAVAAGLLLVGCWSRLSAGVAWALAMFFWSANPLIHNAGDTVRNTILFYLMLCPCGAVWSADAWRRRRTESSGPRLYVYPWPIALLFVQLTVIYFYNGVHKVLGPQWRSGEVLHYVLGDLVMTRMSYARLPLPYVVTQVTTWIVLGWELAFPLLVLWRPTRVIALFMGVCLHIGIGLSVELGMFAPYMLCLYLPLVPWERVVARSGETPHQATNPGLISRDLPALK